MNNQKSNPILDELYFIRAALSQISINETNINSLKNQEKSEQSKKYLPPKETQKNKYNYAPSISSSIEEIDNYIMVHPNDEAVIKYKREKKHLDDLVATSRIKEQELSSITKSISDNIKKTSSKKLAIVLYCIFSIISIFFIVTDFLFLKLYIASLCLLTVTIKTAKSIAKLKDDLATLQSSESIIKKELHSNYSQCANITSLNRNILYKVQKEKEEQRKRNREKELIDNQNKLENSRAMIEKFNNEKKEKILSIRKNIKSLQSNTRTLYRQLKNSILDERDWENLDIIIYELETGRADTIKEALQQTDLLIRHNEIKQAIGKASEAICNTIQQSMSEISFSIERNMLRIHDDFISLSEDQRRIQQSLQDVVSAQELSNALKEKANVSSAQLAADVKRLRELEDYKFYRS